MALGAGVQTTYDISGQAEAVADTISRISPEDTPFLRGAGTGSKSTAILEEWLTDELAAAADNALVDGAEAEFSQPADQERVGNYHQISGKTASVSGSTEAVKKYGRKSQMAFEMVKRAAELKLDQEKRATGPGAADGGSRSLPRYTAGILAFIKTNVSKANDGVDPVWGPGIPDDERTDGTKRAFSETFLTDTILDCYREGGNPNTLMVGPYNKTVFSSFDGKADKVIQVPSNTAAMVNKASVDIFASDFGDIRAVPNRVMRERDALLIDWDLVSINYLRSYFWKDLAVKGDSTEKQLLCEWMLRVGNEKGLGAIVDLKESAAE